MAGGSAKKSGRGRNQGKGTGGRPDEEKSSSGGRKLMVDPQHPELNQLFETAFLKKQEARLDSVKKEEAVKRKQSRYGALTAEAKSGLDEDKETAKLIRSVLQLASGKLRYTKDVKLNMLAYLEASIRVASHRQSSILDIPRFYIPEHATFEDLVRIKKERLERFRSVRSFDIEDLAVVTPPTNLVTYQIIDVTRPSDTDPKEMVSVAQLLFSENNNYFCGARATPIDPTAKGGFFVFADVILPSYFGEYYHMSCSSRYSSIHRVKVSINSLPDFVAQLLLLTVQNCKHVSGYMVELLEIIMFLFGEFDRLQPPVDLLSEFFALFPFLISADVLVYMRNWSYLSKAALAFYLGLLEISLGVVGCEDTYLKGRKRMAAAVRKFAKAGCQLELRGEDGFISLKKLVGSCLQLLKFNEEYIMRLIIRKSRKHSGSMEEIKGMVSVQQQSNDGWCEAEDEAVDEAEQQSKEELAKEENDAKKECKRWVNLLQDDKMMLIEALSLPNMDLADNDQGVGEPSMSPASVPSSSGQGNMLSDDLAPHITAVGGYLSSPPEYVSSSSSTSITSESVVNALGMSPSHITVCSKVPSASEHVDSLPSSHGQGNKLSHGLAHLSAVGGNLSLQPEYVSSSSSTSITSESVAASSVVNALGMSPSHITMCSKVPSAPGHVDSLPSSHGQGNKLSHGLAHLSAVGGSLSSPPEYVSSSSSTSITSESVAASSVVNALGMSPSPSTGSLRSEKTSFNPKSKEFKLNPNAEIFSPSPSLSSHHQPVSDAAYNYPNNMGSTRGLGLPVGIVSPQLHGGTPVVYSVQPGSSLQSYMPPNGPQSLQLHGGTPVVYSVQPGSSLQIYMPPNGPQFLYNAQSLPSPEGYMHPSGQHGQQMMTGQTRPGYYYAPQYGWRYS